MPGLTLIEDSPQSRHSVTRNADPIWLLQNEMYEELHQWEMEQQEDQEDPQPDPACGPDKATGFEDDLPF